MTHGNHLSLFLPVLTFYEIYYLPVCRLPTLISATKVGFEVLLLLLLLLLLLVVVVVVVVVLVVVDLGFTTLLTSQIISVAFYSEREKSDKFCSEAVISA